jgi:type III restriction enzyme
MVLAEYVRRAAAEETDSQGKPLATEQRLVVFPGMELTLSVPCQALLIFDADFPADMFALAMTALAIAPSAATDAKTADTNRLTHIQSLKQLKEEMDKHTYLRDRYIIFPHVGENRQFSLLRKGQAAKYTEMPWVGGYVDGEITKLGEGNRNIVDGKAKEWGNKRIAVYQTSDNRFEDHRDLGKVSTWIKWAIPTAEALRQACLAQESRVSQETPQLPAVAVAGLSVSNSAFLGPIELNLNPQYSALIGGRGTGKSTILEYLRWALCDQPPGFADDETPNYQARRARLIEQTLKPVNATVQVQFEVNGVPHAVRRNSQDGALQIKIGSDAMRPCTEDEVRALLPIQAYSQKQLSDVSVRVEELSRFITAPIRNELNRIERQASDRAERIRQTYATRRRQRSLTQTLQKRELEENSLTGQADTLRAALTGLSGEDRALLDKGKVFDAADRSVRAWQSGTSSVREGVVGLLVTIDSYLTQPDTPPVEPEEAILKAAHAEYLKLLSDAKTGLEALVRRADLITGAGEAAPAASPWRQWTDKMSAFKSSYDAAVQRSSAHSEKMKQLRDIEEQLDKHVRETARVRDELRNLTAAEAGYKAEREAWEALLTERDDLLEAQCKGLTQSSGGSIRAHVKRHADSADFVNGLRQSLSGSRVQGAKIEALGESIAAASDAGIQWNAILSDLEKLAEFDTERDSTERRPETPVLAATGVPAGDLDRIARSLKPEAWLSLSRCHQSHHGRRRSRVQPAEGEIRILRVGIGHEPG